MTSGIAGRGFQFELAELVLFATLGELIEMYWLLRKLIVNRGHMKLLKILEIDLFSNVAIEIESSGVDVISNSGMLAIH